MKISVQGDGHNINLLLPTRMIFSKTVLRLLKVSARFMPEEALEQIPIEKLEPLFAEFRRIKKKYGSWELVDVQSADGEKVKIVL